MAEERIELLGGELGCIPGRRGGAIEKQVFAVRGRGGAGRIGTRIFAGIIRVFSALRRDFGGILVFNITLPGMTAEGIFLHFRQVSNLLRGSAGFMPGMVGLCRHKRRAPVLQGITTFAKGSTKQLLQLCHKAQIPLFARLRDKHGDLGTKLIIGVFSPRMGLFRNRNGPVFGPGNARIGGLGHMFIGGQFVLFVQVFDHLDDRRKPLLRIDLVRRRSHPSEFAKDRVRRKQDTRLKRLDPVVFFAMKLIEIGTRGLCGVICVGMTRNAGKIPAQEVRDF